MKKVYLVTDYSYSDLGYDGNDIKEEIIGVFDTEEKAILCIQEFFKEHILGYYEDLSFLHRNGNITKVPSKDEIKSESGIWYLCKVIDYGALTYEECEVK